MTHAEPEIWSVPPLRQRVARPRRSALRWAWDRPWRAPSQRAVGGWQASTLPARRRCRHAPSHGAVAGWQARCPSRRHRQEPSQHATPSLAGKHPSQRAPSLAGKRPRRPPGPGSACRTPYIAGDALCDHATSARAIPRWVQAGLVDPVCRVTRRASNTQSASV